MLAVCGHRERIAKGRKKPIAVRERYHGNFERQLVSSLLRCANAMPSESDADRDARVERSVMRHQLEAPAMSARSSMLSAAEASALKKNPRCVDPSGLGLPALSQRS